MTLIASPEPKFCSNLSSKHFGWQEWVELNPASQSRIKFFDFDIVKLWIIVFASLQSLNFNFKAFDSISLHERMANGNVNANESGIFISNGNEQPE